MTTEGEDAKEISPELKTRLCHEIVDDLKNEGLTPFESVNVLLAAAASVSLVASNSERADFEKLAGEIFTHFAVANDDVRGRR